MVVRAFSMRARRFAHIERCGLWQGSGTTGAGGISDPALTVFRATRGMGKTSAARELVAHLATGGLAAEAEGPEVDGQWWADLTVFARGNATPLIVLIDDLEQITAVDFAERLLEFLEAHPNTTAVVAGSFVHGLDERPARLRVPLQLITDAQLRFTAAEVAKLTHLRLHGAGAALTSRLFDVSRGWPLAVHDGLVSAARTSPPALPEHGLDQFCIEYLQTVMEQLDARSRGALTLLVAVDELSAPMLASAMGLSKDLAAEVLSALASKMLQQRIDGAGERWFSLHPIMHKVLWRVRRQLAHPDQVTEWARRLTESPGDHRETIAWAEMYAALDSEDWAGLEELLTLHFSDDFIDPPPILQAQLRSIPEAVKQRFPVLRVASLIEEFAFPRGQRARVLSQFREMATRAINTESHMAGAVGVLTTGMRLGSARLTGDVVTVSQMVAQLQELIDRLNPESRQHARTMVATACGQAAIACWYLEEFDAAETWCDIGQSLFGERATTSTVHLASILAVVAAWRGDIPEAERRLRRSVALGTSRLWANHYVAVSYWIAEAIVALERQDLSRAEAAYARVSWRLATNEHWPFMVWINTHLIEQQLSQEHALAWLQRQIASHRVGFAPLPGPGRALEELRARLAWQCGRHHLLPAESSGGGLVSAFAAITDGRMGGAAMQAASTVDRASKIGFWRLEARALQLQVIAERDLGGGGDTTGLEERVARVLNRNQLTTPGLDRVPWSLDGSPVQKYAQSVKSHGEERPRRRPITST